MPAPTTAEEVAPPQLDNLLKLDPYLTPYQGEIKRRYENDVVFFFFR